MEQGQAPAAARAVSDADEAAQGKKADAPGAQLGSVGLVAPIGAQSRLLEYNVDVRYRSTDLLKARALLYAIAARRGFLRNASASAESSTMNLEMAVRASELYDTLKELDATGDLLSENINVTDHTESDYANQLKLKREQLRGARRAAALTGDAAARNWNERETALERSEDASDAASVEKWRIQDRVTWATVAVHVSGPDLPEPIRIPSYRNAFVGLLNLTLQIVYALIYLLPVFAILGLVLATRRRWQSWFKRG